MSRIFKNHGNKKDINALLKDAGLDKILIIIEGSPERLKTLEEFQIFCETNEIEEKTIIAISMVISK